MHDVYWYKQVLKPRQTRECHDVYKSGLPVSCYWEVARSSFTVLLVVHFEAEMSALLVVLLFVAVPSTTAVSAVHFVVADGGQSCPPNQTCHTYNFMARWPWREWRVGRLADWICCWGWWLSWWGYISGTMKKTLHSLSDKHAMKDS